jgi:hypothetical protein
MATVLVVDDAELSSEALKAAFSPQPEAGLWASEMSGRPQPGLCAFWFQGLPYSGSGLLIRLPPDPDLRQPRLQSPGRRLRQYLPE